MSKTVLGIATALVLASSFTAAHADYRPGWSWWGGGSTYTPRIDATQAQQRARIEEGRRNGQLTRGEYERLRMEQDRIAAMERRAKADGVVTPVERHTIRQTQQDASRHIWQEKHDGDNRWNGWYRRWW